MPSVHPRARGDGLTNRARRSTSRGSPPRARGRRRPKRPHQPQPRFTPARAGTAGVLRQDEGLDAVHPRARGDGSRARSRVRVGGGSPPRARGRRVHGRPHPRRTRFTPARAGTAGRQPRRCRRTAVHPRARGDGEHASGSPWAFPVHPRARGDGLLYPLAPSAPTGSPPRARGRRPLQRWPTVGGRFTPARAGTASTRTAVAARVPVHPRARGDGACRVASQAERAVHPRARGDGRTRSASRHTSGGSPPRARGRPRQVHGAAVPARFTPARAGTARQARRAEQRDSVHPRARGDGSLMTTCAPDSVGSPPRARGRHRPATRAPVTRRFTPARAGTAPQA